jgi:hypothetical protein
MVNTIYHGLMRDKSSDQQDDVDVISILRSTFEFASHIKLRDLPVKCGEDGYVSYVRVVS